MSKNLFHLFLATDKSEFNEIYIKKEIKRRNAFKEED